MNKLYTDWATIYDEIYQQLFDYTKDFAFYDSHLLIKNLILGNRFIALQKLFDLLTSFIRHLSISKKIEFY